MKAAFRWNLHFSQFTILLQNGRNFWPLFGMSFNEQCRVLGHKQNNLLDFIWAGVGGRVQLPIVILILWCLYRFTSHENGFLLLKIFLSHPAPPRSQGTYKNKYFAREKTEAQKKVGNAYGQNTSVLEIGSEIIVPVSSHRYEFLNHSAIKGNAYTFWGCVYPSITWKQCLLWWHLKLHNFW